MALQVWLPLINDYKNYGLSDLEFSRSTKYRYIRFVIDAKRGNKDNYTQLSMFQFLDVDNNVYSYPSGTTVSTSMSNYSSSEGPGNILDGNVNTKFCCPWSAGGYLQINLGGSDGIDISKYSRFRWYTANDADWRDPTSFRVLFSTDGTNFIEGVTVTNASITTSRHALAYVGNCLSDGKIGQTCHHNYSNSAGGLISDKKLQSVGNNVSMFAWVNFDNFATNPIGIGGTHTIIGDGYPAATGMGFNVVTDGSKKVVAVNTGTGSTRTWGDYKGTTNISAGTWYHIGFTYNGSQIKIYVNGALDATHNYSGQSNPADYVHVSSWARDGLLSSPTIFPHYKPIGRINDFRIYDHVLSTKEVKLLSQGLVAHYQLKGMGATNYLKGAGKFTKTTPLVRKASDTSVMNDSYVYHEWEPNALFAVLPSAGTYTISVECDGVGSSHQTSGTTASQRLFSFFLQNVSSGTHYHFAMSKGADGRWYGTRTDLVAGTYKVRTNLYAADKVDYTLKFWDMKVTAGAYNPSDTWCPHEEDELYNALGLGLGNEPDCSGFGHNATKSGILETVSGSPRYGRCYRFAGSQYINCGRGAMVTDAITVTCWAYSDDWTNFSSQRLLSCTESGGFNFEPGGENGAYPNFAVGTGTSSCTYKGVAANITLASMTGWHMVTGTYDGYSSKIYIDGVLRGTNNAYTTKTPIFYNTTNSLFIAAEAKSSATTPGGNYFIGNISDVRIYGTALSAEDIMQLYTNAASLAKDGTLMAYDFHENKQNAIGKDGIVSTGGFNDKAVPTYDMKIKALDDGSTWARIHHLDVSGDKTCFANASEVAKCVNKNNRYSRMGIVDRYKAGGEYEFMLTYPSIKKSVPAGYTELEYIQATGGQYIRTGVTGGARWEFDIQFTDTKTRQLMGYGGSGSEYWGSQENGMYGLATWGYMNVASGGRDTIVHDYTGSNSLWVKNVTYGISQTDVTSKQYQIFAIDGGYLCKAKLWRCKCIQNGTLIRDFVPAMRNSDGVIGLFDVVNNAFYTNAGSGYFLCNYSYLDYLQSSGTQYINTGVIPNSNTRIVIKAMLTTPYSIYGVNQGGASFNMTGTSSNGGSMYYYWGGAGASTQRNMYNEVHVFEQDKNICRVDGNLYHTYEASTWAATCPMFLFARNNGSTMNDAGTVRIYECKIYDNGTLIRDFVPCKCGSSLGMFDKLNHAFYGNAGAGTFTYGTKGGTYQWLDYIQNTGVEYINTGYAAPEGFISEAVVEYVTKAGGYILGSHNIAEPWGRNGYGINSKGYWEIGTGDTCPASSSQVALNTRYTVKVSSVKGNSYMDVNGSRVISTTDSTVRCPDNIWVFYNQYSKHYGHTVSQIRLYALKFWLPNGTLIRDFLPCISPSGQVGLYDKVTKRFFGNSGSGYLIAGPTEESIPLYNRWIQTFLTSDVNQGDNISFKPIFSSWPQHLGPLKPAQAVDTAYDCDVKGTGNWFAPIGQYKIWGDGIPAADGSAQTQTELWVRTDRFADEDQLNIYNGSITATDYIEI